MLTKILQIDPKLTFHIFNHVRISKIEKNIRWSKPLPKKGHFWGGVWTIEYFFNFRDTTMIQNMKNITVKVGFGSI